MINNFIIDKSGSLEVYTRFYSNVVLMGENGVNFLEKHPFFWPMRDIS